ncbi:hypothetical protein RGRSB_0413 [cyanobacterium endosymbiont of Rhopalodia gibberula]|uniref:COP23 domain-containing protein n=1 Tax=cyanobacterium endosymbiont of Rhopalodia gibberula TaxID=1763363 RepID=UPI000DC6EB28|nr:COP23 domain-containing protein [cyanobacterium endosymbiont of Rhopalodia gibberula]BBA78996.1 hypothetical protein RGRSB_0413 [cyanobacterium endosymbiont of Rhopalodia gibberula]
MVNNSVKVVAASALATLGLLSTISGAQAHPKYPQYNMVSEGFPSSVDWDSNRAVIPHIQEKVVFTCEAQGDGSYATVEKAVRETMDPDHYPVYTTEDISAEYGLDSQPMMVWTATLPSSHPDGAYIPESRCQTVSARLTNLSYAFGLVTPEQVAQLSESSLVGKVNGERVIFLSHDPENASTRNVIFTLKPENAQHAATTLTQFKIGVSGGIAEGIGGPELAVGELPPVVE